MMKYESAIIDFETLAVDPSARVLSFACVMFNAKDDDKFTDLINDQSRTYYCKFSVEDQPSRTINKGTLEWWMKQDGYAREVLKPSDEDITVSEFLSSFKEFCNEYMTKNTQVMCRGQSFDFPLLDSLVKEYGEGIIDNHANGGMFPVPFWNQNDIRTALRWIMVTPALRLFPVEKGMFEGFVKHNCLHDVCKDAILLQQAVQYVTEQKDIPTDPEMV